MYLKISGLPLLLILWFSVAQGADVWRIDTDAQWKEAEAESFGLAFTDGTVAPAGEEGIFHSQIRLFSQKTALKDVTLGQSAAWLNWNPIPNLGPSNLLDAPILLSPGPGDYWIFGRYGLPESNGFVPESAELTGFDMPLFTTPFPNQFDAPGGLQPGLGGYHAWQSRDFVNWVHHGAVTERTTRWATTAEYNDGVTFIYYDFPNDQDPHLYIDEDLTDGRPGKNVGLVFRDPSHGSDCGVIRALDGRFHLFYEDWSPINAKKHSWDSPLAGHAVSPDGITPFEIQPPAIDERTEPTGETSSFLHPH